MLAKISSFLLSCVNPIIFVLGEGRRDVSSDSICAHHRTHTPVMLLLAAAGIRVHVGISRMASSQQHPAIFPAGSAMGTNATSRKGETRSRHLNPTRTNEWNIRDISQLSHFFCGKSGTRVTVCRAFLDS